MLDAVGLQEIPAGSIDIDLLIGDAAVVGRGVGPAALHLLLEHLREDTSVPLAALTSSIANARAIRAFERAGFRRVREYTPPAYGLCWLLVADVHPASIVTRTASS